MTARTRSAVARVALSALTLGLVVALGACEATDKVLFTSFAGEQPEPPDAKKKKKKDEPPPVERAPALGVTYFRSPPVTMPQAGETGASRTVANLTDLLIELRRDAEDRNTELQKIRAALVAKSEDYVEIREVMRQKVNRDRLQQARIQLDLIYLEIDRLNALATKVDIDRRSLTRLIASAKDTAELDSASKADKAQTVQISKQAANTLAVLDKMKDEIRDDTASQNDYANRQREKLTQIAKRINRGGEAMQSARRPAAAAAPTKPPAGAAPPKGQQTAQQPATQQKLARKASPAAATSRPAPRAVVPPPQAAPVTEGSKSGKPETRRPLVTIRFTQPDVNYAAPLYDAVRSAVARRPDVRFDLLALAPAAGGDREIPPDSSERAQRVLATMLEMGVPRERVRVSASARPGLAHDEVRIYVR
ncbi:MAG: hypothetical protein QNJ94_03750 [Alphaproteobacteria bacterium]|nr:hypothetical protein [Alphaproteobacteria bacterium]